MLDGHRSDTAATLGRCVLVPIANPASVRPLMELAADLVDPGGEIHLLTVLRPTADADVQADAWHGMSVAEQLADRLGVRARGEVRTDARLGDAVLATIRERGASLVLMGWQGASSTSDVFGRLIDHIVGHSAVPLAVVRTGAQEYDRVVLPISADHLRPGGAGGLTLAASLAGRLQRSTARATTVLRTGPLGAELPDAITRLGDRVHHDPRRTHQAVAAFAGPTDLIVAPVAPTVSGLRAATTHLAWAAPDATLLVAIDVGPVDEGSLVPAVAAAGRPRPATASTTRAAVRLVVTVRLPEAPTVTPQEVEQILGRCGSTEQLMAWWPSTGDRPRVRATVELVAADADHAIARAKEVLQAADGLVGAEITYDVEAEGADTGSEEQSPIAVYEGDLTVIRDLTEADRSVDGWSTS